MGRPQGLKMYPALLSPDEVQELLAYPEFQQQAEAGVKLFRLYGSFGSMETPAPTDWMERWGERLVERGVFSQQPNQYRVCDWVGDLSAQFKWHVDNKRHGESILAIALSDGRRIGFRNKEKKMTYEIEQNAGDAYMMRGASRWQWDHCVLPSGHSRSGGKSFVVSFRRQRS